MNKEEKPGKGMEMLKELTEGQKTAAEMDQEMAKRFAKLEEGVQEIRTDLSEVASRLPTEEEEEPPEEPPAEEPKKKRKVIEETTYV